MSVKSKPDINYNYSSHANYNHNQNYKTLFEQQSYQDALDYYMGSLTNSTIPTWDYVILTASNEAQAKAYRVQIEHRLNCGQLPQKTEYAVIPDLNGQRVGSGGATLSCVKYVMEREGTFTGKKILVIHSGGDSKRIPQYSACGKLFSPVPRLLPGGRRSTLFDEFMIGMSTVASRINDGMLVCSGDVLLLFNALQIDFYSRKHGTPDSVNEQGNSTYWELGAAALSIKENVETGKNHGVYEKDADGNVGSFLHKQSVETLTAKGAVDNRGNVDIDTGAVILNSDVLASLYSLISTEESYHAFVNEKARLSFYADFLYPLASSSTLEAYYKEKPEGEFTEQLQSCRTALWNTLHKYRMKLIQFSPASFIHFGTTRELLKLMTEGMDGYRFLGWKSVVAGNLDSTDYAISNSYVSRRSTVGAGSYIEDSRIHRNSHIGKGCVISGATLTGETVLDGTVLHVLKLNDGRFVCRMYGVNDNPKEKKIFWRGLIEFGIDEALWTAKIYPVCDTVEEAVKETLPVIDGMLNGRGINTQAPLTSLKDSFNNADVTAIIPWQENLYEQVVAEAILDKIEHGISADEVKKDYPSVDKHTVDYLLKKAEKLSIEDLDEFEQKIRIYGYLSKLVCGGRRAADRAGDGLTDSRKFSDLCFETIAAATLKPCEENITYNDTYRLVNDVTVNLPVRVNWGGGWSDTPPYCMINGGTVLNAAIKLKGNYPIEADVKRIDKPVIALASTDIGSYKEFDSIEELQDCKNPSDPFALHKAALIACGVIPYHENVSVEKICERLGSGFYMNTRVIDIPKGSGLGTSSILAGACVKALFQAFDIPVSDDEVFARVLCMEQLMSTGGGWQDQVGGIAPGIKMIKTKPGLKQEIQCVRCSVSEETVKELNERFAVIYTGQRRLARNLLRDVVTRYVTNDRDSVEAHYNIQQLAVLMRFELEKGNVDGFAELLTQHWKESQRIDSGSTNTCIDMIFESIDDLVSGKMICGAGGGGFLQVVLRKGVSKEELRERLNEVFQDSGVDVWDCEFVWAN